MSEFTVHPTAIVDDGAEIGADSRVWHWTHICGGARIGERCSFGQNVFVGNDVIVGNNVKVQNNVSIYDAVTLEDDVFCGPSMVFTNVNNPRSHVSRKHEYRRTVIRHGATIGANATIVCGHEVGAFAFIGAGSVVTRDVAPYALMVGTPAHRIGWMCQCGERLPADTGEHACPGCGQRYEIGSDHCKPQSA
jgi:UDP-2-acetamido-3-amino-2,3-dideoxy-glucuronate N-acetyltransferase